MRRGFAREDLFTGVHEQFITDTARLADIVLPATMFMEHDDIYTASAHQYLQFGGKLIEPPPGCRSNHEVICELARRLGAEHRGFDMSPREIIDETLRISGRGTFAELEAGALARLPAGVRRGALPRRFRASGRQVPLPRRLGECSLCQRRTSRRLGADAHPARSLAGQRGGDDAIRSSSRLRRRATSSIPASTNGDLARTGGPADGAGASRGRGGAWIERRRLAAPRQWARDRSGCT